MTATSIKRATASILRVFLEESIFLTYYIKNRPSWLDIGTGSYEELKLKSSLKKLNCSSVISKVF